MKECYVLEPLVIRGFSHSVNLRMSFLQEYNFTMIFIEEEVVLMALKDGSALRVRLVDRGCHSFINKKSGVVLRATKDQMIPTQVWRILRERISINMVQERSEEFVGVYTKYACLIPIGMGKYIPVQTKRDI